MTPDRSSPNWSKILLVSTQLLRRNKLEEGLYQGMSSSLALFRMTRCSFSSGSPSRSPLDTWSKSSSTSSRIRLAVGCRPATRDVPRGGGVPLVADRASSWIAAKELISARYESNAFPFSLSDDPSHPSSSLATRDDAWNRVHSPFLNISIPCSIRLKTLSFASCVAGLTVVIATWEVSPPFSGGLTISKEVVDWSNCCPPCSIIK